MEQRVKSRDCVVKSQAMGNQQLMDLSPSNDDFGYAGTQFIPIKLQ